MNTFTKLFTKKSNKKLSLITLVASTMIALSSLIAVNTATAAANDARQRLNTFFTSVSSIKGSFSQQVFS